MPGDICAYIWRDEGPVLERLQFFFRYGTTGRISVCHRSGGTSTRTKV